MESSPEVSARRAALEREAPIVPRSVWKRTRLGDKDVVFLCGTIGAEFDAWQRRLSVLSAADALLSQQIGLAAVEKVMDELEERAREEVEGKREQGRGNREQGTGNREQGTGNRLKPRRSPGYGDLPLALSRTILAELDAPRKIGVSITDSNLLVPSKSVTAICEIC